MSREWKEVPGWGSPPTQEILEGHGTPGATVVKYCQRHRCEWGSARRFVGVKGQIQVKKHLFAKQHSLNLIPQSMQTQERRWSKGVWHGQKCHRWKYCTTKCQESFYFQILYTTHYLKLGGSSAVKRTQETKQKQTQIQIQRTKGWLPGEGDVGMGEEVKTNKKYKPPLITKKVTGM